MTRPTTRWNEPCGATTRAGRPCRRRAIPGGYVCPNHGGGAPQVKIRAQLRLLEKAELDALIALYDSGGTFAALCRWTAATRDLDAYRAKLEQFAWLRRKVAARDAT
jgi:hypothetical protein